MAGWKVGKTKGERGAEENWSTPAAGRGSVPPLLSVIRGFYKKSCQRVSDKLAGFDLSLVLEV